MKINKNVQIEKASSTDASRPSLLPVVLHDGRLIAIDGRILAVVPVEADAEDVPGPISRKSISAARKLAGRGDDVHMLLGPDSVNLTDGSTHPRPPRMEGLHTTDTVDRLCAIPKGAREVQINVALLDTLVSALGANPRLPIVTLWISPNEADPIVVKVRDNPGAIGVIMPVGR